MIAELIANLKRREPMRAMSYQENLQKRRSGEVFGRLALVGALLLVGHLAEWHPRIYGAAAIVQQAISASLQVPLDGQAVAFASNVTAGNRIVGIATYASDEVTLSNLSCSDTLGNTYVDNVAFEGVGTSAVYICSADNILGGANSVTFSNTGVDGNGVFEITEVSGATGTTAVTRTQSNSTGTTHECGSTGITGTGVGLCGSQLGSGQSPSAGSGWTENTNSPSAARFFQHKTGSFSSDQGPFSTTSSDSGPAAMIFLPEAAAGAPRGSWGMNGMGR
jgi:hypothetical protein